MDPVTFVHKKVMTCDSDVMAVEYLPPGSMKDASHGGTSNTEMLVVSTNMYVTGLIADVYVESPLT
jgi:hypothetical protein